MEKKKLTVLLSWMIPAIAAAIAIYVLFMPPRPGVADQGDFQRIMDISGLQETKSALEEPEFRFFKHVRAEYDMISVNPLHFFVSSSLIYPVLLVKSICKMIGLAAFNTGILAAVYVFSYIAVIIMCLRWLGFKRSPVFIFASFAALTVLLDGNYLIWFNSLYGEPMMIISLLLFTASALYIIQLRTIQTKNILILFLSSFLFLCSKAQCITALPFVAFMHARLILYGKESVENNESVRLQLHPYINVKPSLRPARVAWASSKRSLRPARVAWASSKRSLRPARVAWASSKRSLRPAKSSILNTGFYSILKLSIPIILLFTCTMGFYFQQNKTCGVDTKYNAVFYGILKNSEDPEKDLETLGLSVDLAVEAGKHAYLPHNEYLRYVPWSEITQTEFNEKISNFKLIRFYLLNPQRFINGMKYTASQSFQTGTFLGKYEKKDVPEYTYTFNRFTFWSDFRSTVFPKKLWFIVLVYLGAIIVSVIEYRRRRQDSQSRLRIELLWMIMAIGAFQFPMPFVGNGEADTAKQLFLFNFTFDILAIIAYTWAFNKLFFSNVTE